MDKGSQMNNPTECKDIGICVNMERFKHDYKRIKLFKTVIL